MTRPTLMLFRRDLRLRDHPALTAAAAAGPVIPVFICDETLHSLGAAAKMRLRLGVEQFATTLNAAGSRLILRSGDLVDELEKLARETGAGAIHWSRLYDRAGRRDGAAIKHAFADSGIAARSFPGHLLHEPWQIETGQGDPYKVYTPFWKAARQRSLPDLTPAPTLAAPDSWPSSEALDDWALEAPMRRGARVLASRCVVGERAAQDRLGAFVEDRISEYTEARNRLDQPGTSGLSENLTYGEISPLRCWWAAHEALDRGESGAETFLKELVWREFAAHIGYYAPDLDHDNWREGWDAFPWNTDPDSPEARAWKEARTGEPIIDAAMRELWVTGVMHNRARMIVASYLTKHLLVHWRVGLAWFADQLIDWDPASNALGWQWVAGCGPDAAPFFRIFNPALQAEKFDPDGAYRRRWRATGKSDDARAFYEAIPVSWQRAPGEAQPQPIIDLKAGRTRALEAYKGLK